MITDLPKEFPLANIAKLYFGTAEAKDDDLLLKCATPLPLFRDIAMGKKDIIHGYRGTGKSSIVRLFQEGILNFEVDQEYVPKVLVIDDELEYRAIRDYLDRQKGFGTSSKLLLRIVWDILISYRSMKFVCELLNDDDATLRKNINEIDALFGVSERNISFVELLLHHKKKIGVKIDTNLPSIVDMYASVEANKPLSQNEQIHILRLSEYIKYLNGVLLKNKIVIFVLLDRLDDFVVKEDYKTQKALLQQLLACQTDYRSKNKNIRIISFLRTDLFQRIDLQHLGPDKIAQRSLEIQWSTSDIKNFVAKRLAVNLLSILNTESLPIKVDEVKLWISRDEIAKLEETKSTLKNFNVFNVSHWRELKWLYGILGRAKKGDSRVVNFTDAENEAIIRIILPKEVYHYDLKGIRQEIDLFVFLETHFQLGYGQSTPRAILLYLSQATQAVAAYYAKNPDLKIELGELGEYPLFKKTEMLTAYRQFQESMWAIQLQVGSSFADFMLCVNQLRSKTSFGFQTFQKMCNGSDDEVRRFLSFCTHTGLLQCRNPSAPRGEERIYMLPVVFQVPISLNDRS